MENETLATEMLKELKATSRRWFIAFIIVVCLWFATIIGFVWYITLPIEETTYTQTVEDAEDNDITQTIGGEIDDESNTDGQEEKESE